MTGKLYGVGVGPGDPELITVKALKVLKAVDIWAVPVSGKKRESTALSIIVKQLEIKKEILELYFPMSFDDQTLESGWQKAAETLRQILREGKQVAFLTLGDPTLYSTYMYIHKTLGKEKISTEIIPGISSFAASCAKAGVSLAENRETVAIIPSAYENNHIDEILNTFDNVVLMKGAKNLESIKEKLREHSLIHGSFLVSRCGFEDEFISFDLESLKEEKLSYFTTIIVKKNGV